MRSLRSGDRDAGRIPIRSAVLGGTGREQLLPNSIGTLRDSGGEARQGSERCVQKAERFPRSAVGQSAGACRPREQRGDETAGAHGPALRPFAWASGGLHRCGGNVETDVPPVAEGARSRSTQRQRCYDANGMRTGATGEAGRPGQLAVCGGVGTGIPGPVRSEPAVCAGKADAPGGCGAVATVRCPDCRASHAMHCCSGPEVC